MPAFGFSAVPSPTRPRITSANGFTAKAPTREDTDAGREPDTPTDTPAALPATRPAAAREDRLATPLSADAEAPRTVDPELDESAAGPSA